MENNLRSYNLQDLSTEFIKNLKEFSWKISSRHDIAGTNYVTTFPLHVDKDKVEFYRLPKITIQIILSKIIKEHKVTFNC